LCGGVLKVEVVLWYVMVFRRYGLFWLFDVVVVLVDDVCFYVVEIELVCVFGYGVNGVCVGYLWMLVGVDDVIKFDWMVFGWFIVVFGYILFVFVA